MIEIDLNKISFPKLEENEKANEMYLRYVKNLSDDDFESFIFEWIKYYKYYDKKISVFKVGSTGDRGIDILVCEGSNETAIQCKKYSRQLSQSDVRDIVVKILYYYFIDFSKEKFPNSILIVNVSDFSLKAARMFQDKKMMKKICMDDWTTSLSTQGISFDSSQKEVFIDYLNKFDFDRVSPIHINDVISEYSNGQFGSFRFVRRMKKFKRRPINKNDFSLDFTIQVIEALNTSNLNDEKKQAFLISARNNFYEAVSLRETCFYFFGSYEEFDDLESEIWDFIQQYDYQSFDSRFARMNSILTYVGSFSVNNNYLDYSLHMVKYDDKKGVCHKLVNDGKLYW